MPRAGGCKLPAVKVGITSFCLDRTIHPVRLAREAEARGFESLWYPEHSHIPASRLTPWPGGPNGEPLPDDYWRMHDMFNALSMAAAVTTDLKVGTSVCLIGQRDPIWTAKQIASLDHLSGGRFLFGIGFGWNREEQENHGYPWADRRAMVREKVAGHAGALDQGRGQLRRRATCSFAAGVGVAQAGAAAACPSTSAAAGGRSCSTPSASTADGWMPVSARALAGVSGIALLARGLRAQRPRPGHRRRSACSARPPIRPASRTWPREGVDPGRAHAALRGRRRGAAAPRRVGPARRGRVRTRWPEGDAQVGRQPTVRW